MPARRMAMPTTPRTTSSQKKRSPRRLRPQKKGLRT